VPCESTSVIYISKKAAIQLRNIVQYFYITFIEFVISLLPFKLDRIIKLRLSETYSKVNICESRCLSDAFPIQKIPRRKCIIIIFKFSVEYDNRKFQDQERLNFNWTQFLIDADDVNLF
jgi:hypothetical protein